MPDSENRIWTGFVRQRGSLIAASAILFFYESSGIRVDQITILGNTFPVANPTWVAAAVWLLWLYFLIRYYQYFRDLPKREFSEAWDGRFWHLLKTVTRRRFVREYLLEGEVKGTPKFTLDEVVPVAEGPGDWGFEVKGSVEYNTGNVFRRRTIDGEALLVPRRIMLLTRVRAWLYVITHTRVGTEYLLPFIVALVPVAYPLYRHFSR